MQIGIQGLQNCRSVSETLNGIIFRQVVLAGMKSDLIEPGCRDLNKGDLSLVELENASLMGGAQPFAQSSGNQGFAVP